MNDRLRGGWVAVIVVLAASSPARAHDWLADVETAYAKLDSLQAEFAQTTAQAAFGRTVTASGELVYGRGKMRWDYRYPDPQTYIVTAETVTWIQPGERQVVRMASGAAFASGAPAALLGGMAHVSQWFRLAGARKLTAGARLQLTPVKPDAQVQALEADFDAVAGVIRRIRTVDGFGNVNEVRLTGIRRNVKIDPEMFTYAVPPGWAVWPAP